VSVVADQRILNRETLRWQDILANEDATTADYTVGITSTNSPVDETTDLDADVDIENVGGTTTKQDIILSDFDDDEEDAETVSINPGDSLTRTLTWQTEAGDNGTGDIEVSSFDDADTQQVTINKRAIEWTNLSGEAEFLAHNPVDNTILASDDDNDVLRLLDAVDGTQLDSTSDQVGGWLDYADGRFIFYSQSNNDFRAIDANTLSLDWSQSTSITPHAISSDESVVFGPTSGSNKHVIGYDVTDGTQVFKNSISTLFSGEVDHFAGQDYGVFAGTGAYDETDGSEVWLNNRSGVKSAVATDTEVYDADDNDVYQLDVNTGSATQQFSVTPDIEGLEYEPTNGWFTVSTWDGTDGGVERRKPDGTVMTSEVTNFPFEIITVEEDDQAVIYLGESNGVKSFVYDI